MWNLATVSLGLGTLLYILTAIGFAREKDWEHAWAWVCYTGANAGFLFYAYKKARP